MRPHPPSLQGQLIRSVLAVVGLIWSVAAGAIWFDARHELDELLDAHLAQAASLLLIQRFGDFDGDDIVPPPASGEQYASRVMFQVYQSGALMLKSADAPSRPMVAGAAPAAAYTTVMLDGVRWRAYKAPDRTRAMEVIVAERLASRQDILWAVLRSSLWPLAVALPLLAAATWWVVRRGTAPIRALGRAVVSRQPHALEAIVVPEITRELQPLLLSMNGLFQRIALLLDSERRFTADAAHELRTPIAAIRMQAQVAAAAVDAASRRHALDATINGCDRATRLVEQLLTLSRLEVNGVADQRRLDLRELLRQVVTELALQSALKHQELGLDADTECPVRGNEMLLTVMFRNLIDNAIRYSPQSARIAVRLRRERDHFVVSIDDSGPGMGSADLPRLGERFFRVPGNGACGSGLGWSITRRIAAPHGFELHAEPSTRLGGLEVRISGPLEKTSI
ncbi:two-component system sensor histidine kinase QseC [Duganella sp. 1411]|uniref:ATP-binding protein n=1 Tax=Duganella sp. 1411 TaxID=2806572 RepID=UPI001AE62F58|nr:ATP-binding protein [Duganella sp. 1411]MBP1202441.1 two-component system sensor histidine kinase QseC [Duganella sp. 1411]